MPELPPDRARHGAVVVRRYRQDDAEALHAAILSSIEHLRPWMPWAADEPRPLRDREELIATWTEQWDTGGDHVYGVFVGAELVGGCGFHRRIGPTGLEIGYWIRADRTGRGHATDAAAALVGVAFTVDGVTHVEIHHDKANVASGRVPARLGFTLVREVDREVTSPGEVGTTCEWSLRRDQWSETAAT